MKKLVLHFVLALCISASVSAQLSVIADSLASPIGIKADQWGNVWVASVGTGNDDASICMIARNGEKFTVIKDLPSKLNPAAGDVVGPWRAIPMTYGKMAVLIGGNPTLGPDFGKLLFFNLANYQPGDEAKTIDDTTHSFQVGAFGLATSTNNDSDPFSAVQDEDGHWYITDAGANTILKVSRNGKEMSVFTTFDPIPNPTPVGPPVIDAVPTGIVALPKYGGFLVTTLTGFPFLDGQATIYKVDRNGNKSVYASGLTLLTDIDMDKNNTVYVNQFGTFSLANGFNFGSGQVIRLRYGKVVDTIVTGHGPGSGLSVFDGRKLYVTNLFLGSASVTVVPSESVEARELVTPAFSISLAPNPATERVNIKWEKVHTGANIKLVLSDLSGKILYQKNNIDGIWPQHQIDVSRFQAGTYVLTMNVNGQIVSKNINIIR